jgi:hypothetical protein
MKTDLKTFLKYALVVLASIIYTSSIWASVMFWECDAPIFLIPIFSTFVFIILTGIFTLENLEK